MRSRRPWLAGYLTAAAVLAPAALAVATCADKGPANPNTCPGAVKIEPVTDGTYLRALSGRPLFITLDVDERAQTFAFTTDVPVTSVIAKGGTGSLAWAYPQGAKAGSGLHAPPNPRSGKYYGLSHVCLVPGDPPGQEPPPLLVEEPPPPASEEPPPAVVEEPPPRASEEPPPPASEEPPPADAEPPPADPPLEGVFSF